MPASHQQSTAIALPTANNDHATRARPRTTSAFGNRLYNNNWAIPYTDKAFLKSSQHLVFLIGEMRASVNRARSTLIAEMQGDEGAADCLIWRNASKEYKRQAIDLDDQMRELIVLAKVANRMLKEVIRVCNRGERKALYEQGATLEITPDFALSG